MPNWCENQLTVHGDWKSFKEKIGERFKLETFLPTPEPEQALEDSKDCWLRNVMVTEKAPPPKERLGDAWYYWRIQHWGTKWDVTEGNGDPEGPGTAYIAAIEDNLQIRFDTAWSPPSPAILSISAQFPDLEFTLEYLEFGNDFCGIEVFKAGALQRTIEGAPSNKNYDMFPLLAAQRECIEEWERDDEDQGDASPG